MCRHPHIYIYICIHIYICVCVCVRARACVRARVRVRAFLAFLTVSLLIFFDKFCWFAFELEMLCVFCDVYIF